MARSVAEIQAGGAGAAMSGDELARDAGVFGQVLDGLRQGGAGEAQKVTSAIRPPASLEPGRTRCGPEMKKDLDAILGSSQNLFRAQSAATSIDHRFGQAAGRQRKPVPRVHRVRFAARHQPHRRRLGQHHLGPRRRCSRSSACCFSLSSAQRKRYQTTMELNNRNQEAIMRLLDEMGSLAEGDLTVKATVTEDMTGAIADSINFAVEQLRSLVTTINDTSVQVASSAQETQATAMHLAEAAEHQAQEITSASDRISEIAASIDQVSKNSAESAEVAQRSVQIATNGAGVVRQTIQGMDNDPRPDPGNLQAHQAPGRIARRKSARSSN